MVTTDEITIKEALSFIERINTEDAKLNTKITRKVVWQSNYNKY